MHYPFFFNEVPTITLYDPLAELLGSLDKGVVTFDYLQIVQIAGHSCPTVAGAYLSTHKALSFLYENQSPLRGGIKVSFKDDLEDGVTGVISNVISHITGATDKSGFKGINNQFARNKLLFFNAKQDAPICFTRLDTNQSVFVYYDPSKIKPNENQAILMQKIMQKTATKKEKLEFGLEWQNRVQRIFKHSDEVIKLKKL
jgi:hypothetical protein